MWNQFQAKCNFSYTCNVLQFKVPDIKIFKEW